MGIARSACPHLTYEICISAPPNNGYITTHCASIIDSNLAVAKATVESVLPPTVTDCAWHPGYGHADGGVNDWLIIQTEPSAIVFLMEEGFACLGCGTHHPKPTEPKHTDKDGYTSYGGCARCGDVLYNSIELANEWTPAAKPDTFRTSINIVRRICTT